MLVPILVSSGAAALVGSYTAIATRAARAMCSSRRRYPEAEPDTVGLAYEDVWLPARGESINLAAWHLPAPGATRAIIMAHGVGGCRGKEFTVHSLGLVAHLVRSGFTVLMLDLRGHGESDAAPMTWGLRERRDVLGAVDWLLARGYAPGSIGILGASMGGVAGMGAALEEPAIGALISDSACADFLPMMQEHFPRMSKLPAFFFPGTLLMARLVTGENLARLRPAELIQAVRHVPTMIIHSRGDRMVPVAHAEALALAGKAELWLTESNKHLGSYAFNPTAYRERVTAFFERTLVGEPGLPVAGEGTQKQLKEQVLCG
ncbi:MAG: alpha/beta fold hydrolase [Chloroflexaceae bacterium]|jgi:dipeptidyl aminopeptidase/acylaminoacyl peptidase|nr:alpha/beta fold hydrolase [Chloroflexaceae bacterium]